MTSELRPAVEVWSDPSPPNDFCPYDHCSAKVPFGTMRIEWKSWKDYPNYCLYFDAGETFIGSFDSLDRAKEHAAAVIEADREAVRAEQAAEIERLKSAWRAQHKEKVAERAEAKLWFMQAQEAKTELDRIKRERDQAVETLREIAALDGEINPSNYDHDDACYLNRQFCYAGTIANQALASIEGTGHE